MNNSSLFSNAAVNLYNNCIAQADGSMSVSTIPERPHVWQGAYIQLRWVNIEHLACWLPYFRMWGVTTHIDSLEAFSDEMLGQDSVEEFCRCVLQGNIIEEFQTPLGDPIALLRHNSNGWGRMGILTMADGEIPVIYRQKQLVGTSND